jgi:prefoldin subunit 5
VGADDLNMVLVALGTGFVTAVCSSLLTIAGLRVQIKYLEQADEKHDKAIVRAHERIDEMQRNATNHNQAARQ